MVFGPVGTNWGIWWGGQMSLKTFLTQFGNIKGNGKVDGISLHFYPAPTNNCPGYFDIINSPQDWYSAAAWLEGFVPQYDTRKLPLFLSEVNNAVGKQYCDTASTVASALVNADGWGVFRETNVDAVQFYGE
jgi:hypothetical protein